MKFFPLTVTFLCFFASAFSQQCTVSGYIKDAAGGQTIPGVSVFVDDAKMGAATNAKGYYSFSVPAGNYHFHVSLIGYRDTVLPIKVFADKRIDVTIYSAVVNAQTVNILGEKADHNVTSSQMGTITLQTKDIKAIPVFMGDPDILKVIQLLPGVMGAGDANTGLYVRGGGPDQNLVLLDGATVYNAGHLLGFFSIFNSDAISDVTLIKGNMPANYGGRISSVLDIETKE